MIDVEELKVGDKIRIVDEWTQICHDKMGVNEYMNKFLGQTVTVRYINPTAEDKDMRYVVIEEDGGCWRYTRNMIEDLESNIVSSDIADDVFAAILIGG